VLGRGRGPSGPRLNWRALVHKKCGPSTPAINCKYGTTKLSGATCSTTTKKRKEFDLECGFFFPSHPFPSSFFLLNYCMIFISFTFTLFSSNLPLRPSSKIIYSFMIPCLINLLSRGVDHVACLPEPRSFAQFLFPMTSFSFRASLCLFDISI